MTALLVALDVPTLEDAERLGRSLLAQVNGFKIGLELLMGDDSEAVERIHDLGLPVFVDAKLHDIPATVEKAARQLGRRGARWVTAHTQGGSEMMLAGATGLHEGSNGVGGILGVTVLTSLDITDLVAVGINGGLNEQALRLAAIAERAGAEGVICSVEEATSIKEQFNLLTVTPGIRFHNDDSHDQKRVATVEAAMAADVDYLVVGRAITASPDPVSAAVDVRAILESDTTGLPPDGEPQ